MEEYQHRPQKVEAIQFTGDNMDEILKAVEDDLFSYSVRTMQLGLELRLEFDDFTEQFLYPSEWLIRSRSGNWEVLCDAHFQKAYEKVTNA